MTASTVPAAKQALVDAIGAQNLGDLAPQVSYGTPVSWQADALVWVGEAHREIATSAMVGSGGTGWLREDYSIDVHVRVSLQSADAQPVDVACYALVALVEQAVRVDPSLGGVVAVARPAASTEDQTAEQPKGRRVCHVIVTVHCTATI